VEFSQLARILIVPRDDTLALRSGGCTQDQGMAKLSNEGAMVFLISEARARATYL
jgi:hypothetical protein